MANLSIIDPEGDYIFVCGETEIQVSSKVLSLASPVFSALFSPRFAEGQPTQNKPTRIKLYDDDPESMRFMCAILHHKSTRLSAMAMKRIEMLAVLTDKYDVRTPSKMLARTETNIRFLIHQRRMRNQF